MGGDPLRERAERRAYRLLTRRAHSERELFQKLVGDGYPEAVAATVLETCRRLGYLDDGRYARQRARDLAVNRLAGDRRIAADLRARGIDEALIEAALDEARREMGEAEALTRLLAKRARGADPAGLDERQRARLARGMIGKGFAAAAVYGILKGERGYDGDDGQ